MSALTFLGLARGAGRVEVGEEHIAMAARAGRVSAVIIASDAGKNAVTRSENAAAAAHCPVSPVPFTAGELGAALGLGPVSAAGITDIHLASAFFAKLSSEHTGFEDVRAELAEKDARAMERQREARRHRARHRKK